MKTLINLTNQRMIPESGIMERQRQNIKGMSPGSAALSPSTIHRWWFFFLFDPKSFVVLTAENKNGLFA